jgi:predicted RNA-binding Zn ribbon-like protein
LQQTAEGDENQAVFVLERAYALREAIYRIFVAQILGKQPVSQDLEILNKELEKGITGARVIPTASGFAWEWREQKGVLDCMLGPLARSAATLLTSAERLLVRQCESTSCSWLFVDTTKNHSRVWCRTTICGNKDRARRYRQRQHRQ